MSKFLWNFIYREEDRSIRVWNGGELKTTISAGNDSGYTLSNNVVLDLCQKWLDEHDMLDVEYKVFVELH